MTSISMGYMTPLKCRPPNPQTYLKFGFETSSLHGELTVSEPRSRWHLKRKRSEALWHLKASLSLCRGPLCRVLGWCHLPLTASEHICHGGSSSFWNQARIPCQQQEPQLSATALPSQKEKGPWPCSETHRPQTQGLELHLMTLDQRLRLMEGRLAVANAAGSTQRLKTSRDDAPWGVGAFRHRAKGLELVGVPMVVFFGDEKRGE